MARASPSAPLSRRRCWPVKCPTYPFSRVEFNESGVASAKREYLRVESGMVVLDSCALVLVFAGFP